MLTGSPSTLRDAAERLRRVGNAATPGPWTWMRWHSDCPEDCDDPACFLLIVSGSGRAIVGDAQVDRPEVFAVERSVHQRGEDDARFIAMMHPGVAHALATWFDAEAETWEQDEDQWSGRGRRVHSLQLARLVLAERVAT